MTPLLPRLIWYDDDKWSIAEMVGSIDEHDLIDVQRKAYDIPLVARSSRILRLYDPAYDYPRRDADASLAYMIAALPRSGSTHLAVELWRTGVMGSPLEYPNVPFRFYMRKRLGTGEDIVAYWNAVRRIRTSANGVFGFKMFVSDYQRFARARSDLLPLITPDKVVFLTREDLVAQAVSYSRAIRSGRWFADVHERKHPSYDAKHIGACVASLRYQIDFWHDLFMLTNADVHRVTYEELSVDRDSVVRRIADFLRVTLDPEARVALPVMRVQRDAESAEWVRRYRCEVVDDGAAEPCTAAAQDGG